MAKSNKIYVFTDGSVDPVSKVGYGASLVTTSLDDSIEMLQELLKVKRFENTSSTKLEIQTLLWVLEEIIPFSGELFIYTDSQNIVKLLDRQGRLEKNNFHTKQNRLINNSELYQDFFRLINEMDIRIVKIRGHNKTRLKDYIDKIFTLVDRASRKALREKI